MSEALFSLQAATLADVPVMAKITSDSFKLDRNTQVKAGGKAGYDLEEIFNSEGAKYIASPNCRVLKAIHKETGVLMGWCCWGFRGFEAGEVPPLPANDAKDQVYMITESEELHKDIPEVKWSDKQPGKERTKNPEESSTETIDDGPKRLEKLTRDDMARWMEVLMPEGAKCMFIVTLSVSPEWQSRGVASAFLKWGAEKADEAGVFCWVHSSDPAWTTYAKVGFEVIGTLDIDLDEYAVGPPPSKELEGSEGKWGHYIFRYMKRLPK